MSACTMSDYTNVTSFVVVFWGVGGGGGVEGGGVFVWAGANRCKFC